jgi:hypothetical protein
MLYCAIALVTLNASRNQLLPVYIASTVAAHSHANSCHRVRYWLQKYFQLDPATLAQSIFPTTRMIAAGRSALLIHFIIQRHRFTQIITQHAIKQTSCPIFFQGATGFNCQD